MPGDGIPDALLPGEATREIAHLTVDLRRQTRHASPARIPRGGDFLESQVSAGVNVHFKLSIYRRERK
jgi:hypothetical protein